MSGNGYEATLVEQRLQGIQVSDRWSEKAQLWIFSSFELIRDIHNATEHGAEPEMQRLIHLAKCERSMSRLYLQGQALPHHERHCFRDRMEVLLARPVSEQEKYVFSTGP